MKELRRTTRRLLAGLFAAALVAGALCSSSLGPSAALAADHRDGSMEGVQKEENIPADINDVFAFIDNDKVILGMTVFPAATVNAKFSDAVVYVFRIHRHASFGAASDGSTDVFCSFEEDQTASCWINQDTDYANGDASDQAGLESELGKFRVFAGLRADPFYFNLDGFNAARTAVFNAFGGVGLNLNGCPIIDAAFGEAARGLLVTTSQDDNFFANLNTLAIVIEADKDLFVDDASPIMSVHAATHVRQ